MSTTITTFPKATMDKRFINDTVVDIFFNNDILCTVLSYMELSHVPSVAQTCRQWNRAVQTVRQDICQAWIKQHYPRVASLVAIMPNAYRCDWSRYVQQGLVRTTSKAGLNRQLQQELQVLFRPAGILSYSNCCHRSSCMMKDNNTDFTFRQGGGALFFRLYLDGYFYSETVREVTVIMEETVMDDWDDSIQGLINVWCAALGVAKDDYVVTQPEFVEQVGRFQIQFKRPLAMLDRKRRPLLRLYALFDFTIEEYEAMLEELEDEGDGTDDEGTVNGAHNTMDENDDEDGEVDDEALN